MAKTQPPAAALDTVDRGILRELGDNPELTNKALATRLGIAESTCAYRVRALRDNGVITGRRLDVDTRALGYPLQAVIKVRLGSHSQEHVEKLYDDLVRTPGVIQAFHVAGADDFHLYVAVEDAEALRDFVLQHVTVHRVVRQTETLLVFELREGPGVLPRDTA
ncbi:AsnC family transcriptional regulator [Nocardioides albus]|uniref:DNA-binding Lrp family transcriptional regulator n=1 Tax=Nocardioides albus TaxID=1841 RepID=A0A7W5A3V2_9ACTN|nr:Lrp/AsnC family transcriptional regulator [Nocardioides albus]MBB3089031.1 DNA-binding Lrp family transcriptional regulator [Nocardioides albus]GGU14690.1 AsnC family transcriptional regulator [Nocardioides albus]